MVIEHLGAGAAFRGVKWLWERLNPAALRVHQLERENNALRSRVDDFEARLRREGAAAGEGEGSPGLRATSAADSPAKAYPQIEVLEAKLRGSELQRDELGRQLEDERRRHREEIRLKDEAIKGLQERIAHQEGSIGKSDAALNILLTIEKDEPEDLVMLARASGENLNTIFHWVVEMRGEGLINTTPGFPDKYVLTMKGRRILIARGLVR